jgi:hypothetical protein
MLAELSAQWLAAKEAEREAIEVRRAIEDQMLEALRVSQALDGTENYESEGYKVKVVGRLNRKIDAEKLQELAIENGVYEHLQNLFRWKPEINAKAWNAADPSITNPLLGAITTTPGRPSFTITIVE